MLFRSHATMWSCALDNGPFAAYEKTYNERVLVERKEWGGKGRLPFYRVMRAVRAACDSAFEPERVKNSFTATIFSPLLRQHLSQDDHALYDSFGIVEAATATDDSPVMIRTAGSDDPAIPAFHFDIEAVVQRMTGLRDSGYDSSKHAGAGRDVAAARRAEKQVGHELTRLQYTKTMLDDIQHKGLLALPNGCDPQRVDDPGSEYHGQFLCIKCRHTESAAKNRAKTTDTGGGCHSLRAIIDKDEQKEMEKEQQEKEKEEKRAEREQAAAEKQQAAEEKREELLTSVGKLTAVMNSLSEMPASTSADIATQIEKIEAAAAGLNKNQHPRIAEARQLVEELKQRKKDLVAAEQQEKKREQEAERREQAEEKRRQAEKRKQDLLDEKHQAIEKKRKTAGDDLDRWSAAVRKAAGGTDEQLRAALVAILAEHKTIVERERV